MPRKRRWRRRGRSQRRQCVRSTPRVCRALRSVLDAGGDGRARPTALLHELDLWPPGAARPIELDVCAQRGAELWIGEAKKAPTLGSPNEARSKLAGLRRAARYSARTASCSRQQLTPGHQTHSTRREKRSARCPANSCSSAAHRLQQTATRKTGLRCLSGGSRLDSPLLPAKQHL